VHGHVRFYSDHVSDRPAFEWADEPVAVNPHEKLRRLAEQRGWAIKDWG
jgi:phosphoserine phosphatase